MRHLGLRRPLALYHEHNAERGAPGAAGPAAQAGASVALVSDAGTPAISDPGFKLVRARAGAGQRRLPGPGPLGRARGTGGIRAADRPLPVPGLPAAAQRRTPAGAEELAPVPATLVLFESPQRLAEMLADAAAVLGARAGRGRPRAHQAATRSTAAARWPSSPPHYAAAGPPKGEAVVVDRAARRPMPMRWTTPSRRPAAARRAAVGQAARRAAARRRRHRPQRQRALPPGAGPRARADE